MTKFIARAPRRRLRTWMALGAVAAGSLAATGTAAAAPVNIQSGSLTWGLAHESTPGTGSLSNYATTIGHGSVVATTPATGGPITSAPQTPAAAAGLKVPFTFPGTTSGSPASPAGSIGTYDPVAKTGSLNFAGTLTFTAHDGTFFSVINPRLQWDAPQSARVIANGKVAAGAIGSTDPPVDYGTAATRQTVFALNAAAATQTINPDGTITIGNLVPSGTPTANPTGYLSSTGPFDGIRPWFTLDRPNQSFSVTLVPEGSDPDPDPDPPTNPTGSDQGLDVNGTVGNVLSLALNSTTASLGTFAPGTAANYDASVTGTATSTVPSVLYVRDAGSNPGSLVNGTKALGSPLKVCATSTASPACSYSNLGAAAQQLLSFPAGASGTPLTVGLRQSISASEPLSAGTYGKTLTFTLSAGTP